MKRKAWEAQISSAMMLNNVAMMLGAEPESSGERSESRGGERVIPADQLLADIGMTIK